MSTHLPGHVAVWALLSSNPDPMAPELLLGPRDMWATMSFTHIEFYLIVKKELAVTLFRSAGSYSQAWLSVRHNGLVWDVEILAIPVWVCAGIFTRSDPLPGFAS